MAIGVLQVKAGGLPSGNASSLTVAFDNPVQQGSTIHGLWLSQAATVTFSNASDSVGDTYNFIAGKIGTNAQGAHFYFPNSAGGNVSVTANQSISISQINLMIAEIGQVTATPLDGHIENYQATPPTTTDGIVSGTVTPSAKTGLIACFEHCLTTSLAQGTGFSLNGNFAPPVSGGILQFESARFTSAVAQQGTFTCSPTGQALTFLALFDEAPGPGEYPNQAPLYMPFFAQ